MKFHGPLRILDAYNLRRSTSRGQQTKKQELALPSQANQAPILNLLPA